MTVSNDMNLEQESNQNNPYDCERNCMCSCGNMTIFCFDNSIFLNSRKADNNNITAFIRLANRKLLSDQLKIRSLKKITSPSRRLGYS